MKLDLDSEHSCPYCVCVRSASRGVMYVATVAGGEDEAFVETLYKSGMDCIDKPLRELAKKCPELRDYVASKKGEAN